MCVRLFFPRLLLGDLASCQMDPRCQLEFARGTARSVQFCVAVNTGWHVQALFQLLTDGKHRLVVAPEFLSQSFRERIAPQPHSSHHR
jgi:hypothetical protein